MKEENMATINIKFNKKMKVWIFNLENLKEK